MAKVICPACHLSEHWRLADGRRRCKGCRKTFRSTHTTQFRLSRYHQNRLIEYFCLGVPVYRLRFLLPISLPTMRRFFRFLRQLLYDESVKELEEARLSGSLEMDETVFGGKVKGKRGWGAAGKHMVFGMYKRNGHVLTFPVPNRSRVTLTDIIFRHTSAGSLCYTDDWHAYTYLSIRHGHVVINKERGRPAGRDTINGIEGFWSYAKHWLYQYRGVPRQYFHLYLKETEFRFNHRAKNLIPLVKQLIKQQIGTTI